MVRLFTDIVYTLAQANEWGFGTIEDLYNYLVYILAISVGGGIGGGSAFTAGGATNTLTFASSKWYGTSIAPITNSSIVPKPHSLACAKVYTI